VTLRNGERVLDCRCSLSGATDVRRQEKLGEEASFEAGWLFVAVTGVLSADPERHKRDRKNKPVIRSLGPGAVPGSAHG
jgi:hypothetical protein